MAGVSSVGVGSGLDLEGLITRLLDAERTPKLTALASREASIQADISAFGSLRSVLDQFKSTIGALADAADLRARTATTSDPKYIGASATGTAVAGSYDVQVLNLAKAQKLVTRAGFADANALVGEGTLSFSSGSGNFTVDTTASTTLGELKDLINNAAGNTSVSATLIVVANDPLDAGAGTSARLVLSSRSTGAASTVEVAVSDIDGNHTDALGLSRFHFSLADLPGSQLDQQQAARDAAIAVDGFTAFSSSNTFTDVIDGVTLTALREPADPLNPEVATLSVAENTAVLGTRINSFVKFYNDVVKSIRQVSGYDAAAKTAGPLNGDPTVRAVATRLRSVVAGSVEGAELLQTLADIGITTQRDGTLAVDTARLNAAIADNSGDVIALFAGEDGLASRFDTALESFIGRDGIFTTRTEGLDRQVRSIDDQREALALRLEKLEKQYRDRFSALDALVAQLQRSGDYLLAQLENTAAIISRPPGSRN
jgi:flagellar hook-associated protein 2